MVLARFMVDPIWWLYITWLPKYLSDARGFSLRADRPVRVGAVPRRGRRQPDRRRALGLSHLARMERRSRAEDGDRRRGDADARRHSRRARRERRRRARVDVRRAVRVPGLDQQRADLPSDFFPARAVGSVAGLGGFGAGLGSMLFTLTTGWVVRSFFVHADLHGSGPARAGGHASCCSRCPDASDGCGCSQSSTAARGAW